MLVTVKESLMRTFKEVDRKLTISFFLESDFHRKKYPERSFLLIKCRNMVTFKTLFNCVVIFRIVGISYEPFFKEGRRMKYSELVPYKFSLRRPELITDITLLLPNYITELYLGTNITATI